MADCVFCKIVRGEIPSYKIAEDENHMAFLTIQPFKEGHTLVVPKVHIDYLFAMEDQDLSSLMVFTKKVADKLLKAFNPASGKIGVYVVGDEVPHAHIHLIPFNTIADMSFSKARDASPDQLQAALKKLNNP